MSRCLIRIHISSKALFSSFQTQMLPFSFPWEIPFHSWLIKDRGRVSGWPFQSSLRSSLRYHSSQCLSINRNLESSIYNDAGTLVFPENILHSGVDALDTQAAHHFVNSEKCLGLLFTAPVNVCKIMKKVAKNFGGKGQRHLIGQLEGQLTVTIKQWQRKVMCIFFPKGICYFFF